MKKKIDNKLIIFILVIVFIISLNYNNIVDYFSFREGLFGKKKDKNKDSLNEEEKKMIEEGKAAIKALRDAVKDSTKERITFKEFLSSIDNDTCDKLKKLHKYNVFIIKQHFNNENTLKSTPRDHLHGLLFGLGYKTAFDVAFKEIDCDLTEKKKIRFSW